MITLVKFTNSSYPPLSLSHTQRHKHAHAHSTHFQETGFKTQLLRALQIKLTAHQNIELVEYDTKWQVNFWSPSPQLSTEGNPCAEGSSVGTKCSRGVFFWVYFIYLKERQKVRETENSHALV